ncbi:hypothetical protein Glove_177g1 [Diversispora epigaea]|uniref:Uncharacterized protein n=1 Tax=Diversispora epigaea TaxID=1348612 RepID=A0A397IRB3_9GLOM|nr:hypothetical protein Glove_177g1 [Diversispora epigaea]
MNNMNNSSTSIAIATTSPNPTRKRGRPKKEKANIASTTLATSPTSTVSASTTTTPMATPACKRGRPRKIQKTNNTPDINADFKRIAKIKEFIKKHVPSVIDDTEDNVSEKSKKMAQELWNKVNDYEKKYLV